MNQRNLPLISQINTEKTFIISAFAAKNIGKIFNYLLRLRLAANMRMNSNKQVSEIDNMALTGILSVQILNDLFVNRSIPDLKEEDLLQFDKIMID